MKKLIFTSMIIGSMFAASAALATPRLEMGSLKNGGINCESYTTDLCIENFTQSRLFFSIPQLGFSYIKIPANDWVDASSDNLYNFLNLTIYDKNKNQIYHQLEPNHSVVPVGLEKNSNKLVVGFSQ